MVLGLRQKLEILVFIKTASVAKLLSWQQHQRCRFVSFVMHFCGAKFQEHCFNINSRDIVYSVFCHFSCRCTQYDVITDVICIIEKRQYLWNENRYFKKKNAIVLYFERPFKYKENIFCVIYTLSDSNEFVVQLQIFRNSAQLYPRCHRFFLCGFHCRPCLYCDPREECFSRGFAARAGSRWSETKYFLISAHRAREKKKNLWYPGYSRCNIK